ncbi:hypothetical protein ABZX93_05425 [Streptomyces sp. NPDC006632]|uniref:hypothetical protein n=1 Tax=Streptomyces sp. NPDC006632 TaxID=3157182 RepID=UPI0033A1DD82
MSVYDWAVSLWRTAVPIIVGWAAALLVQINVDIDETALSNGLVAAFTAVYYGLFRLLEAKVNPRFGWFLGLARPPSYPQKPAKAPNPVYGPPPV